jgi:hypothetical protein
MENNTMISHDESGWTTSIPIYIGCGLLLILFFAADLVFPLGYSIGVLYILVILLSLWSSQKRILIHMAIISSLFVLLGLFLSPGGGEVGKGIFNRTIALLAIWSIALISNHRKILEEMREKAVRDHEKALGETKILRGLLPICASCKKIRNDTGYWTQMEAYIRDNSQAEFSHGICPECAMKLYPEYLKDPDHET